MSTHFKTTINSLGNEAFPFFGCLHEIVEFGVVKNVQSVLYSTESEEDLLRVFLQLGKFVLWKS
jgi:hypothetical protein